MECVHITVRNDHVIRAVFDVCPDVIELEAGVGRQIPVDAERPVVLFPPLASLMVQIDIGIPQGQLDGPDPATLDGEVLLRLSVFRRCGQSLYMQNGWQTFSHRI